ERKIALFGEAITEPLLRAVEEEPAAGVRVLLEDEVGAELEVIGDAVFELGLHPVELVEDEPLISGIADGGADRGRVDVLLHLGAAFGERLVGVGEGERSGVRKGDGRRESGDEGTYSDSGFHFRDQQRKTRGPEFPRRKLRRT